MKCAGVSYKAAVVVALVSNRGHLHLHHHAWRQASEVGLGRDRRHGWRRVPEEEGTEQNHFDHKGHHSHRMAPTGRSSLVSRRSLLALVVGGVG